LRQQLLELAVGDRFDLLVGGKKELHRRNRDHGGELVTDVKASLLVHARLSRNGDGSRATNREDRGLEKTQPGQIRCKSGDRRQPAIAARGDGANQLW
jgi:hypothetical protein